MLWQLSAFPSCKHHVFLSHCREDRASLVAPLYEALLAQGIEPWMDVHHYAYGPRTFEALRNGVLASRHTAFLVTPALLRQPRGWSIVELAWAYLLQENLQEAGGELLTVALPLVFVDRKAKRFTSSVWRVMCDRCPVYRPDDGNQVEWALRHIRRFVRQQQQRGLENARWLQEDRGFRERVRNRPGMRDRITCRHPTSILPP